ncbi:MAG: hypothetical protein LBN39_07915 [Planctomycetaceae bacterium]|jgi:hypothetical protein|nr:hypothetical protein [Planctomycetaceae bacterium]
MSNYTSFTSSNTPISDPPEMKYIGMFLSGAVCILLLALTGFIVFEFLMDTAGYPLYPPPKTPVQSASEQEQFVNEPLTAEQIAEHTKMLSPLPDSIVSMPKTPILCTWTGKHLFPLLSMDLSVDGIPVQWEMQFGSNTWVANVELPDGEHILRTPVSEMTFFTGTSADSKRKPMKMHPDSTNVQRCGDCHHLIDRSNDLVRKGHGLTIGAWKGNESCTECHHQREFWDKHLSVAHPEENCGKCHIIHGYY